MTVFENRKKLGSALRSASGKTYEGKLRSKGRCPWQKSSLVCIASLDRIAILGVQGIEYVAVVWSLHNSCSNFTSHRSSRPPIPCILRPALLLPSPSYVPSYKLFRLTYSVGHVKRLSTAWAMQATARRRTWDAGIPRCMLTHKLFKGRKRYCITAPTSYRFFCDML